MRQISKLRIPQSFVEFIPEKANTALRQRVSWHPYHILHAVTALRGALPIPSRPETTTAPIASMSEGAWYDRIIARKVTPNPTPKILEEQTLSKQRQMKCPVWRLTETSLSRFLARNEAEKKNMAGRIRPERV